MGPVRVMSSAAQLVILSIPSARNDLVVGLENGDNNDLVGELLGVLAHRYHL